MSFEITILGSNSALPTSTRFSSAQVLKVRERFFLLDCGEGTQIQLRKYKISFAKISHIFISHLHGDHFFGLPGLLSSFNLLKRTKDLHIYAHAQLKEYLDCLFHLGEDLQYKIIFHELTQKPNHCIFDNDYLRVYSIPLMHRVPVCGFLFIEKPHELNIRKPLIEKYSIPLTSILKIKKGEGFTTAEGQFIPNDKLTLPPYKIRKYAYITDTVYLPQIAQYLQYFDILYHETTFMNDRAKEADITFHSTTTQAATLAQMSNVKRLLIGHFSARYKDIQKMEDESKLVFPNTTAVCDGMVIKIEQEREKR